MSTIRYCPKCGKKLVAKQNRDNGQTFWGCKGYPKCKYTHLKGVVDFVCEDYLKVDWYPNITYDASLILELCQSKVEIAYLLGAVYCIDRKEINRIDRQMSIEAGTIQIGLEKYPAAIFVDPYLYWDKSSIPSTIAFVPQFPFAKKLHHDFGLFFSSEQWGGNNDWYISSAIEVDAHPSHDADQNFDAYRDRLSPYKVIRLKPGIDDYLTWFENVLYTYD